MALLNLTATRPINTRHCAIFCTARGKAIEILANYEPALAYFNEWWKQLLAKVKAKITRGFSRQCQFHHRSAFAGGAVYSGWQTQYLRDHALGVPSASGVCSSRDEQDADGLNYLAGMKLSHVNRLAFQGTVLAHTDGGAYRIWSWRYRP